jgi:transcription-repair coupling factor (superfamily II helicase)
MSLDSDRPLYDVVQARGQTPAETLLVYVARDENQMDYAHRVCRFFDPDLRVLRLPPWDTDPYSRISPDSDIMAERLATLSRLHLGFADHPTLLVIAAGALLQKVAPASFFTGQIHTLRVGDTLPDPALQDWLREGGYKRASTVRQRGEFCFRGGIVDVFPPFSAHPVRLDRFGDTLESLRAFDPLSQCTVRSLKSVTLSAVSEVILTNATIQQFKEDYRVLSEGLYAKDPLYQAIDAGQSFHGMEHWLPLFHGPLVSVADSLPKNAIITWDAGCQTALAARWSLIQHLYEQRVSSTKPSEIPYHPVPVERLFVPPTGMGIGG